MSEKKTDFIKEAEIYDKNNVNNNNNNKMTTAPNYEEQKLIDELEQKISDHDYKIDEQIMKEQLEDPAKPEDFTFPEQFIPDHRDKDKLYLSDNEKMTIDLYTEKHKNIVKDKKILELNYSLIKLQEAIIESKRETLAQSRMIIDYQSIQINNDEENLKKENKQFLEDISNNNDRLKGVKWGYDDDTGEIIID